MITEPLLIVAAIFGITYAGFALSEIRWLRGLSAALLIMLFGALLSNLGVLPFVSPVYHFFSSKITSISIILLLLSLDIGELKRIRSGSLFVFAVGVCASALGSALGALWFGQRIPEIGKLAGALTGTYSGGSMNFVAIGRELRMDRNLFIAATAADNLTTAVWLIVNLSLPALLYRLPRYRKQALEVGGLSRQLPEQRPEPQMRLIDMAFLGVLSLCILWAGTRLHQWIPVINKVLWITTIALFVGQIPYIRRFYGAHNLGNLGLHLFFAVIGIGSHVSKVFSVGVHIFYYTLVIVCVHGIVIYVFGCIRRMPPGEISVLSQAAIGGPSTAMAVAMAKWPRYEWHGMIFGLLGYAVGNYLGFGVAWLFR